MTAPDRRIVLPRGAVVDAALRLCAAACAGPAHDPVCLVPLVKAIDDQLAQTYQMTSVSTDCLDKYKHRACSGCACQCHRHHQRGKDAT